MRQPFEKVLERYPSTSYVWSKRTWLAALLVGAVAAGFRLYHLASAPPGLHHDEAVNGLDILITIPNFHPIFFELNNGREPLFIYLQAFFVSLFGPSTYSLRLTSAVVGTFTVLATYWLGREWYGRRVAVVASLGLAVSFWYVDLSRVGLRAVAAPLFLTLGLAFLWRGMRSGHLLSFGLAALAFCADLYTYSSARVIPFVALAIVVWELARNGRHLLGRWPGLVLGVIVTIAVMTPLGVYFAGHRQFLFDRADQVWIFNPNPSIEGERTTFPVNVRNTLEMFFVRGDLNPRQNLPGRPVFDLVAAPWFVLGILLIIWQAIRALILARPKGPSVEVDPSGWLLLWLAAMLSLGVLTYESPDFLRLSALAPAVFLTWAVGIVAAWRWAERRIPVSPSLARVGVTALVVVLVGWEGLRTFTDYFEVWAPSAEVYKGFDSGLTAAAHFVQSSVTPGTPLMLYVDRSPPIQYLSPTSRDGRWLQEYSNLLLLPPSGSGGVYVYAGDGSLSGGPPLFFPNVPPAGTERDAAGDVGYLAYRLSAADAAALAKPAVARETSFGDASTGVDLLGYTLSTPRVGPGQRVTVTLVWKTHGASNTVYAPYLHVLDQTGRSWGQDDRLGYVVNSWRQGDIFLSRHVWEVPPGTPPLTYHFEVGMATRSFGFPPGPSVALGPPVHVGAVEVTAPEILPAGQAPPAIAHPAQANLGAGIDLLGFATPVTKVESGDNLPVDLLLHASTAPNRDVLFDLILADSTGHVWSTQATRPAYASYPTSLWPTGAVLLDPRQLPVPGATPSGSMRLSLRAVDASTQEPLGSTDLGTIQVVEPPRNYALPKMQHPVSADFGGEIALRGYDIGQATVSADGTLDLTLYWQDERAPTHNYTVFTHLLDSTNQVVAQVDSQPAQGTLPTLGWVPGQVVKDVYQLKLPASIKASELVLEVGMYDATNGQRLTVSSGDNRIILQRVAVVGE